VFGLCMVTHIAEKIFDFLYFTFNYYLIKPIEQQLNKQSNERHNGAVDTCHKLLVSVAQLWFFLGKKLYH
jgi:hypothetical protein